MNEMERNSNNMYAAQNNGEKHPWDPIHRS